MLSRKGLEIPVNMLVILAISVIVLLSVVVFFIGGFTPGSKNLQDQQAFSNCASSYVRLNCPDPASAFVCGETEAGAEVTLGNLAAKINVRGEENIKTAAGCRTDESFTPGGGDGGGDGGDGIPDNQGPTGGF